MQDFDLIGWQIHAGVNTDAGYAVVTFGVGLDGNGDEILPGRTHVRNEWELRIRLGKDRDSLSVWFHGHIKSLGPLDPDPARRYVRLQATGWGNRAARRIAAIRRYQGTTDGLALDDTDNTTRISDMFRGLLSESGDLAFPGAGSLGVNVDDVDDVDIRLPDYVRHGQTVASLLSELAQTGSCYYGIDPDRRGYFRIRGAHDSGFLISADLDHLWSKTWPQDKIMYVGNRPWSYKDLTTDSGYTILHGLGAQYDIPDHGQTTAGALANAAGHHYAFPFTPSHNNVNRVSLYLELVGAPDHRPDMTVRILGATSAGLPDSDDVRKTVRVNGPRLEAEGDGWFAIPFDRTPCATGETLFVVVDRYPDATDRIELAYQSGSGTHYRSSNGTAWSIRTGNARLRTWSSRSVHIIAQNTIARRHAPPSEAVIQLDDFPTQESAVLGLTGLLESLGRTRRIYDPIMVFVPTVRPPLGSAVRVIRDGEIATLNIIGYDIRSAPDDSQSARGATTMTVTLEEYF